MAPYGAPQNQVGPNGQNMNLNMNFNNHMNVQIFPQQNQQQPPPQNFGYPMASMPAQTNHVMAPPDILIGEAPKN